MTQADLLTTARLKLSGTVRRGEPRKDCVLLRHAGGALRLVLTPAQAAILTECFCEPRTVPEALVRLLGERACPPLNEYYELVLQSHAAGVLVSGDAPAEESLRRRWPIRLPAQAAGTVSAAFTAASAVALLVPRWSAPGGWMDWPAGWLAACLLLSLGEAAAACALSGKACEVRGLGVRWLTLLPHFSVDSDDAAMDGREREAAVAALRAMPVFAGAALAAWKWPGMLAPVLAGVFYVLAPWRGSAAHQWLNARLGAPRLSVQAGFIFAQRREDAWERLREWWRSLTVWTALHWLLWTILIALSCVRLFPGVASRLPVWFGSTGPLHLLLEAAVYSLAAGIAVAGVCVGRAYLAHWWLHRRLARPLREDSARGSAPAAALAGDHLSILKQVALFKELPDEILGELATVLQSVEVSKGRDVFREDDPGDAFYVVLSGEVTVLKRRPKPSKRVEAIGLLGPGMCFGEISLLEGTVRTATVRTTCDTHLLKLEKAEFDRLVVGRVGAERVCEVLQKVEFLGRLVFLAGWPFDELVRYARQCSTVRFEAGTMALTRGQPNRFFYLIFDGAFEARDGQRVLRRMGPGDYFGEISLLRDDDATADVVAIEESRCLTLVRTDFLKLFASDFRIGTRMESLAAKRLAT